MKTVCNIVKIIETVMRGIVAVVAAVIIMFAAYSLYDTFYINKHAFSSVELKQYKPIPVKSSSGGYNGPEDDTETGEDSFKKLKEANEDARGWISVYNTHIDYPVVQGKDDLEYATKDSFGKASISGAIYLKTDNSEDLSDSYNVIFGHHMDNGAMFGDLEKYKEKDYFDSHLGGWLYAGERYYSLDIFGVMLTDAYDQNVYDVKLLTISQRIDYIANNSLYYRTLSESDMEALREFEKEGTSVLDKFQKSGDPAMVLALSTCESAITNGRIVVFAKATPVDYKDLPIYKENDGGDSGDSGNNNNEPNVIERLKAVGHPFGSDTWSFLNLVCAVYCLVVVLPLAKTGSKFRQSRAVKKADNLYNGYGYDGADAIAIVKYGEDIKAKLKRYRRRIGIGTALEIAVFVSSVVVFLLTQDMTTPVVMCDKYTPAMILLSIAMFVTDVVCFVYRDSRILTPEEVTQMNNPDGNRNGN